MLPTRGCWILWLTTPGHTCHPLALEDIRALWHVRSFWPKVVQIFLDVVSCALAKTMAHPKIGDEWLMKRECRFMFNPVSFKAGPRSRWCRQTVIGQRASPLPDRSQEAGCFEVAIFFISGAGFKPRVVVSTGEAELYAQIQSLRELLSLKYLMEEL